MYVYDKYLYTVRQCNLHCKTFKYDQVLITTDIFCLAQRKKHITHIGKLRKPLANKYSDYDVKATALYFLVVYILFESANTYSEQINGF